MTNKWVLSFLPISGFVGMSAAADMMGATFSVSVAVGLVGVLLFTRIAVMDEFKDE